MASASQQSPDFLGCLGSCLEAFGGVPAAIVTDNLKPAVNKASKSFIIFISRNFFSIGKLSSKFLVYVLKSFPCSLKLNVSPLYLIFRFPMFDNSIVFILIDFILGLTLPIFLKLLSNYNVSNSV